MTYRDSKIYPKTYHLPHRWCLPHSPFFFSPNMHDFFPLYMLSVDLIPSWVLQLKVSGGVFQFKSPIASVSVYFSIYLFALCQNIKIIKHNSTHILWGKLLHHESSHNPGYYFCPSDMDTSLKRYWAIVYSFKDIWPVLYFTLEIIWRLLLYSKEPVNKSPPT